LSGLVKAIQIELADEGREVAMLEKLGDDFRLKGCSVPNQHLYIYIYGGFCIIFYFCYKIQRLL